jgi:DNA-binding GntR family transcriptional regulator
VKLNNIGHPLTKDESSATRTRVSEERDIDMVAISQPQNGGLVTVVVDWLREAILTGRLRPGERIRQHIVAESCGTSRIPVRDALRQLEAEGLVTLVSNSGARVAEFNAEELSQIYELRERIEPLAAVQSIPKLSAADIDELRELSQKLDDAAKDGDASTWVEVDRRFHLLLLSQASPRLVAIVHSLWNATQHYRRMYFSLPERAAVARYEHALLLDAVVAGTTEEAELLLLLHIRRTRRTLERLPPPSR